MIAVGHHHTCSSGGVVCRLRWDTVGRRALAHQWRRPEVHPPISREIMPFHAVPRFACQCFYAPLYHSAQWTPLDYTSRLPMPCCPRYTRASFHAHSSYCLHTSPTPECTPDDCPLRFLSLSVLTSLCPCFSARSSLCSSRSCFVTALYDYANDSLQFQKLVHAAPRNKYSFTCV